MTKGVRYSQRLGSLSLSNSQHKDIWACNFITVSKEENQGVARENPHNHRLLPGPSTFKSFHLQVLRMKYHDKAMAMADFQHKQQNS